MCSESQVCLCVSGCSFTPMVQSATARVAFHVAHQQVGRGCSAGLRCTLCFSLSAHCVAACEAFGQHIGPANGIEKMERERPAAGVSATWYRPVPASLGKYMGSKGPGFLEMLWHATARPLSDDACMAVVPHDDLPYLMKAICLFFCSLLSVMHPVCAVHAIVRVQVLLDHKVCTTKTQ